MDAQKKAWKKPVLIIIGRGTPEEIVLAGCKSSASGLAAGPDPLFTGCKDSKGSCQAHGNS